MIVLLEIKLRAQEGESERVREQKRKERIEKLDFNRFIKLKKIEMCMF
jgi:hypothetical protein